MHGFPMQQAKVQRPPLRAATLHRERSIRWLEENLGHRVLCVTAEAGYGKTTLLADFARRGRRRILWYRLDEDDANWISFARYLVAAGRQIDPEFAPETSTQLSQLELRWPGTGRDHRVAPLGVPWTRGG